MSTQENAARYRRWFDEGCSRGNLDLVDELYSPDYVTHSIGPDLPPTREGLKLFIRALREGIPDLSCPVEDTVAQGDRVAGRFSLQGTHSGTLFGIPASNLSGFWSYNDLNNGILTAVSPNDVHFVVNGPGAAKLFGSPFGSSPRNALKGPAINVMNLGVFKNTNVMERIKVQFRAEFFNVLNHPSPGYGDGSLAGDSIPDIFIGDASFAGSAFADKNDMTLNRRVIQFGLRIIF